MSRVYSRKTTCNELIPIERRQKAINLYQNTQRTLRDIADITGIPVDKLNKMTEGMQRQAKPKPLSCLEITELLMSW